MADEAIREVVLNVRLHGGKLGSGHGVNGAPRRGCTRLQRNFQVVLAVRGKGVGLDLRKDVKEIVVSCWHLGVQIWVGRGERGGNRGRGGGGQRGGKGGCEEGGGGGKWDVGDGGNAAGDRSRRGEEGGNEAGGGAQGGVESEGASLPINAGVVACQPWKTQHQRKVGEVNELEGNVLCVGAMNAYARGVEVSDGGGRAAVDEFHRDGVGVGGALQLVCGKNRGVQEGAGGAGVDERQHGDREVARYK